MKKFAITGLFCLLSIFLASQNSVSGLVQDAAGQAIPLANVILLNAADTSFERGAVVNEQGSYLFEKIVAGPYLIKVTAVGFNTVYTHVFRLTADRAVTMDAIQLEQGITLGGVTLIGEKPVYEPKIDRLIINVSSIGLFAGITALDILERSTGINVDRQNGSISLLGKTGVNVMINGKLQYMPVSALLQFLDGTSSDNIERIELITTPPARYDAEGDAGYINIVLRKQPDEGLNGSFSLSHGYGRGHVANNNLNLNFRKNRLYLFGSYSFLQKGQEQHVSTNRAIQTPGGLNESNTNAQRDPVQRNHNFRFGMDYHLSDKTTIGGLFSTYDNKWTSEGLSINDILDDGVLSLRNSTAITEHNQWRHYGVNFNVQHQFTDKEFVSIDVDYLIYDNENPTDYINAVSDGVGTFPEETFTQSIKVTPLDILVGKLDYHKSLSDRLTFDAGVKAVHSSFDNAVLFQTLEAGNWIPDLSLTSNSTLAEQVLAGYVSADLQLGKKTTAKLGMRYEHTDSKLDSELEGRIVDRQFGKLFPSAFLSHTFSETVSGNLSYSRRITRPTFKELAPFVILLDPTTFFAGNAAIQPAIADAVKLDLRYKTLFLSVQYTFQDSTIARFQQRYDPETDRLLLLSENLKNSKILSFTMGFPLQITPWWNSRTNAIYFHQENNSYISDRPIRLRKNYVQVNTSHSFKLPKGFSSEIAFFYTSPRIAGTLNFGEIYGLNLGLQKKLGERWGTLRLNVSDVLNSVVLRGTANVPDQNLSYKGDFDLSQRTFTLSYSRNFGNQKLKSGRKRKRGAAEEAGRMN